LADKAYSTLLERLADQKKPVPPELRRSILTYFQVPSPFLSPKAQTELEGLKVEPQNIR
jgi:hypothetical protein